MKLSQPAGQGLPIHRRTGAVSLLVLILCVLATGLSPARCEDLATGRQGIAATIHPIASTAAIQAMREGGNAIDAAVAAALTLGVVDAHNSGIGGGCFMLIRLADHSIVAFDGREQAPAAATRDMFIKKGEAQTSLSQTGPLAAGIPGSLAVYDHVLHAYGKLSLARHLEKAAQLAEEGFAINRTFAQRLAATAKELTVFPGSR
ncbi:MAG TPA: gamma-glutamyltransferase, partial [Verrucomicrobiae bacterium]|nr:gamma-glutamyltransferase [Verrucomicrobiae bacterium]